MEDCSTDVRLQQETLCRRQWTDEYVEHPEALMRQNAVVVWIQCLLQFMLVDVVARAGGHTTLQAPVLYNSET